MHYSKGNPSKLPYITYSCIVRGPSKNHQKWVPFKATTPCEKSISTARPRYILLSQERSGHGIKFTGCNFKVFGVTMSLEGFVAAKNWADGVGNMVKNGDPYEWP